MKTFGIVVGGLFGIVLLVALGLGIRYASIHIEGFFQPLEQNIQRQVFEETKSYNEGKEQELVKYRLEYMRSDDEVEKAAIASAVRHAFADYDSSRLEPELEEFLNRCRYGDY